MPRVREYENKTECYRHYYETNKAKYKEHGQKYYGENKEQLKESSRKYYALNKDRLRELRSSERKYPVKFASHPFDLSDLTLSFD